MLRKTLLAVLLVSGWALAESQFLQLKPAATITDGGLPELSGLAACIRVPGFFWGVNDADNPPNVYAINASGALAGPPVQVVGAENVDWEAICAADGKLYVGDIGDNRSVRNARHVYVLPEPDPRVGGPVRPERKIALHFPDQVSGRLEHDCEAMFLRARRLWFLTKQRTPVGQPAPATRLYRLDDETTGLLKLIDQAHELGGYVTDACLSPDGKTLAVLALSPIAEHHAMVWLFQLPEQGDKLLSGPRRVIRMDNAKQAESVAFLDADHMLLANEQRQLFLVPVSAAQNWP